MEGKRLIEKIRLRNILSFGDKGEEIELLPLNVIIGQNASGKSNLVDVIKLLRSLSQEGSLSQEKGLINFISKSGGINEWLWKGNPERKSAEIEINFSDGVDTVNYIVAFSQYKQRLKLDKERITNVIANEVLEPKLYIDNNSILSKPLPRFIDKDKYFAFAKTRSNFANFTFFTDIETNRSSDIRKPQSIMFFEN
jgi:predicted ATPase